MAEKMAETPEGIMAEAVKMHKLGVDGDKEAVRKAHKMFTDIFADNSQNVLAEAYLGSATALLGRDEIDPNKRFQLALRGLKMLDRAVTKEPENIEIRVLRGLVCYRLPDMYFHRLMTAVEDFNYLVSRYEADKKLLAEDFYCQTLFNLGKAYKQLDRSKESESMWRKLWSAASNPKYLELLKREGFEVEIKTPPKQKSRRFGLR